MQLFQLIGQVPPFARSLSFSLSISFFYCAVSRTSTLYSKLILAVARRTISGRSVADGDADDRFQVHFASVGARGALPGYSLHDPPLGRKSQVRPTRWITSYGERVRVITCAQQAAGAAGRAHVQRTCERCPRIDRLHPQPYSGSLAAPAGSSPIRGYF